MRDDDRAAIATTVDGLARPLEPLSTGEKPRLDALRGIRAILFDVYGTLLISASGDVGSATAMDSVAAARAACLACAIDPTLAEALVAGLRPAIDDEHRRLRAAGAMAPEVDIREIWHRSLRAAGVSCDAETVLRLAVHYEIRVNPTWQMPGATECLSHFAGRRPMGIVSNAQVFTPVLLATQLGSSLDGLGFDPDLCTWSYRLRRAKPGPRMFAGVLKRLGRCYGIAPWAVAYVGNDMRNDVLCAARAGCRTVLFAGDARSLRWRSDDPACATVRPDAVITRLDQLATVVAPQG